MNKKISADRRERMWDAVYSAVFGNGYVSAPATGRSQASHDLDIDQLDRDATFAADGALERLDKEGNRWGPKENS